jgi:hypothetical protein
MNNSTTLSLDLAQAGATCTGNNSTNGKKYLFTGKDKTLMPVNVKLKQE